MTQQSPVPVDPADDLPEQMKVRREKRERMLADGVEPYPVSFSRTSSLAEVRERYADLPTDTATGDQVSVTGRVIFVRNTGKLCFATLRDGDGTELQAMLSLDRVGAERLEDWKRLIDLGDLVGITGEVITSRRGSCPCSPSSGRSPPRRCARCRWRTSPSARRPGYGSGTST